MLTSKKKQLRKVPVLLFNQKANTWMDVRILQEKSDIFPKTTNQFWETPSRDKIHLRLLDLLRILTSNVTIFNCLQYSITKCNSYFKINKEKGKTKYSAYNLQLRVCYKICLDFTLAFDINFTTLLHRISRFDCINCFF